MAKRYTFSTHPLKGVEKTPKRHYDTFAGKVLDLTGIFCLYRALNLAGDVPNLWCTFENQKGDQVYEYPY